MVLIEPRKAAATRVFAFSFFLALLSLQSWPCHTRAILVHARDHFHSFSTTVEAIRFIIE